MDSNIYLTSAVKQFQYYKSLGEKTFVQLTDEQLLWRANEESNSIATIVKHLSGNMLSRWTNFLSEDGEKEWRKREAEFEPEVTSRDEMFKMWNEGWACLFAALEDIHETDVNTIIYIRNQGHSITDAINRQLCHYAYHVGQIVYMGKMMINENWLSLSIPKGGSQKYNDEKFSKPKEIKHFTDEQ